MHRERLINWASALMLLGVVLTAPIAIRACPLLDSGNWCRSYKVTWVVFSFSAVVLGIAIFSLSEEEAEEEEEEED